jgi:hypothetical protein
MPSSPLSAVTDLIAGLGQQSTKDVAFGRGVVDDKNVLDGHDVTPYLN